MAVAPQHRADVEAILATRTHQGADFWATPEGGLAKGGPFSTLEAPALLVELGVEASHEVLRGAAELLLDAWREDGRFRLSPSGAIYPCHTINAVRVLSLLGHASDDRVRRSFQHLLGTLHDDGGWRCRKFSYGRGPETEFSNPGPTLAALDALRLAGLADSAPPGAVDLLLGHWETRRPLGPCHYGIGSLFMQVGYPFGGYNLFFYVHVLSSYERARDDPRFHEALSVLQSRLVDGRIVVERVHRSLAALEFCRKGEPSELATARYSEILSHLDGA
ncbi:prenyltransferase [Knoellia aerolata]|uniref:Prenyltransferase-like protein n=1 Tax=Knoellia aerolata DSM 18566 TaxID=1385519 RepID=A0A0A0JTP5_9MICO|nr:prenyltransferase [Knoellia aerolata]KGN40810.1 prenyltransferase-like protein [Knoellia aerolata DSM 18566]